MEPTSIPEFLLWAGAGALLVRVSKETTVRVVEEADVARLQGVGSGHGLMYIAQDRAHHLGLRSDLLLVVAEVDIAVGQTIPTRLGHDQDPQLPDGKEPVITMTTSQDAVAVSTITKAEVGLAAGGTVPSERRVSRCKLIGFRMALPGKRTGQSRWEKDHRS